MRKHDSITSLEENAPHLHKLLTIYKKRAKENKKLPGWFDITNPYPVAIPTSRKRRRIAGWVEGADLRQLNRDIREYLANSYRLRNGETVVVVNRKRDRVAVVLRQFGLVFHTSKATGKLSTVLTASLLVNEILE